MRRNRRRPRRALRGGPRGWRWWWPFRDRSTDGQRRPARSSPRRIGVVSRRRLSLVLVGAALLAAGAGSAARDPLERVEGDLRTGHYERARKAAEAVGPRSPLYPRATILAARAERQLGLLHEA